MLIDTEINGESIENFKAHLVDYEIGECTYENGYLLPLTSIFPIKTKEKISLRSINLTFDFEGDTKREILLSISRLTSILQKNADILLPDGFYYYSVYEGSSSPKEKAPWIMQVEFSLLAFRHDAMKTEFLENGSSRKIFVEGNCSTPVIYKIIPKEPCDCTINDITVKNVTSEVIIDGLRKTVFENGTNKFSDTDMTEFPLFNNGYTEIKVTGNIDLEISYYPIYL